MYLLIVFLPLLGTLFAGLFGYKIGSYGATRITVLCITLTFLLSCFAFFEVALAGSPCYIEFFKWFDSELLSFSWGFLFDTLTVVMLVVVTSISMCVHLYSTEYMSQDPHIQRFMAYLSLFTFFMIMLVTADNFFQLFLGWEGVGLCSYLLVNFWFGRLQANKAAIKAMVVNRIGDIGLAIGIFLIYYIYRTIDYSTVFALTPLIQNYTINFFGFELNAVNLICIFFFIAATGKSAQIGLHTWLPDAMEGPTPVSALIHAATMVTAGVFLIVRCSPIFEYAPTALMIVTISGAMTAFMAATIGLVQNDLKRVIAYSTCSQLGYMMVACGTSGYAVGMFHLTNHAFFKALLFLSAGSIIHALADEQDMRKMGGLLNLLPFTYSMMLIGSLSLMGFPFLTGFYSKDLILEWTFSQYSINGLFGYWLGAISAFFTAFYSLRVICLTFLQKPSVSKIILLSVHDAPLRMGAPLLFLSFFSIFIGFFFKDMFVGLGTDFWGNSIFVLPQNVLLIEAEFLPTKIKIFPVCLSLLGATSAFILYNFYFKLIYLFKMSFIGNFFYVFFNRKWFFDKIYNYLLAHNILVWGYSHAYQNIDRGVIEFFGPTGIYYFINNPSNFLTTTYNKTILLKNQISNLYIIFYIFLSAILFTLIYQWYFINIDLLLSWIKINPEYFNLIRESTEKLNKQYVNLLGKIIEIENIHDAIIRSGIGQFQCRLNDFNETLALALDPINYDNHNLMRLYNAIQNVDEILKNEPETKHLTGNFFSFYFHMLGLTQFTSNSAEIISRISPTCFPCKPKIDLMYFTYIEFIKEFSATTKSAKSLKLPNIYEIFKPPMTDLTDPWHCHIITWSQNYAEMRNPASIFNYEKHFDRNLPEKLDIDHNTALVPNVFEYAQQVSLKYNRNILGNAKTAFISEKLNATLFDIRDQTTESFAEFSKRIEETLKSSLVSTNKENIEIEERQIFSPGVTYVEKNN